MWVGCSGAIVGGGRVRREKTLSLVSSWTLAKSARWISRLANRGASSFISRGGRPFQDQRSTRKYLVLRACLFLLQVAPSHGSTDIPFLRVCAYLSLRVVPSHGSTDIPPLLPFPQVTHHRRHLEPKPQLASRVSCLQLSLSPPKGPRKSNPSAQNPPSGTPSCRVQRCQQRSPDSAKKNQNTPPSSEDRC